MLNVYSISIFCMYMYPPFLCVPDEQCRQGTGLDSSSCDVLKYMHTGFSMMQMAADTALMRVRRKG